jgi:hypothetical protein
VSYGYRKPDQLLNQDLLAESTFLYKSGFWQKNSMTLPETLYTKDVSHEPRFLPVTHTTSFDIQINRYEFLKSGLDTEQINYTGLNTQSEDHVISFPSPTQAHVSDTHSHSYSCFSTATCGVSGLLWNKLTIGPKSFSHDYKLRWDYSFFNLLFSLVD